MRLVKFLFLVGIVMGIHHAAEAQKKANAYPHNALREPSKCSNCN